MSSLGIKSETFVVSDAKLGVSDTNLGVSNANLGGFQMQLWGSPIQIQGLQWISGVSKKNLGVMIKNPGVSDRYSTHNNFFRDLTFIIICIAKKLNFQEKNLRKNYLREFIFCQISNFFLIVNVMNGWRLLL